MFYYVFDIEHLKRGPGPDSHPDDLRVFEDRREAWMYMKILGAKCRVAAK